MLLWLLLLGGGFAVAASTSSSSSSSKGAGGFGFDGKAYSDESISEGELAEAASHGDKQASDELARRQAEKWGKFADNALGTGTYIADEAKAGYDIAKAINDAVSKDLAADANTPEQKARLAAAVARIVTLGFPPTRFAFYAEFGVSDEADVIETDIHFVESAPTASAPFMGTLNYAELARQIGAAAIAATSAPDADLLLATFRAMANRRSAFGFFGSFRALDLWDYPPTADNLATARRPIAGGSETNPLYTALVYVACAAAGRFPSLSRAKAFEIVASSADSFNARHGIASRADALSTAPANVGILGPNGPTAAGPVCCEAWFSILDYARKNGIVDVVQGLLISPIANAQLDVRATLAR